MFNSNASSADAGGANYIEDVFSTWVYAGSNSATSITNGIDLAGEGGLVWTKGRTGSADNHLLIDTVRGVNKPLRSNETGAQYTETTLTAFNADGYSITGGNGDINLSGRNYVSWTFREQPKFFDVVTYTGTGSNRTIAHNLGSAPGCMIVKCTSNAVGWNVYHRSLTSAAYQLELNTTSAEFSDPTIWNSTAPTSTEFSVGTNLGINGSGRTYVAYLFAHNAGGFGLTGTDNVISCGSFTGTGSDVAVTLGYEPQWLLVKKSSAAENWGLYDNMRGMFVNYDDQLLFPNTSDAEVQVGRIAPTATGFSVTSSYAGSGATYIYIAIRRGPMKVPTSGTSVFSPTTNAGTGSTKTITTNFPVDLTINSALSAATHVFTDRLRGGGVDVSPRLYSQLTDAETNTSGGRGILFDSNTGFTLTSNYINGSGDNYIYYGLKRAPGFFDEVCYTGTGVGTSQTHNLSAIPELKIIKSRSGVVDWVVGGSIISGVGGTANSIILNSTAAVSVNSTYWAAADTSTTFSVRTGNGMSDGSGSTYVAYLFASAPGVSKVGSYTGTATTLQINCGFTSGARFVLIKRTDDTGDWYVWDSARGIVAGNDPYLLLNSTAAEVTGTDYVDTYSAGFELTSTAPAALNASGGTYIFLAIA